MKKALEVLEAQQKAHVNHLGPYLIAQHYADLGDKDQAFRWLNVCYEQHVLFLAQLPTDFPFNSLRSDPRYKELIRKMGLPQ